MKAVILAGGVGTRLSEETQVRPKPMVEVGGHPILWHIMKSYSAHGIVDFVICCGYRGYMIKEYFANYFLHMSDVTFDMVDNQMEVHERHAEPWRVTLVDTGGDTQTGGRLSRVADYLNDEGRWSGRRGHHSERGFPSFPRPARDGHGCQTTRPIRRTGPRWSGSDWIHGKASR